MCSFREEKEDVLKTQFYSVELIKTKLSSLSGFFGKEMEWMYNLVLNTNDEAFVTSVLQLHGLNLVQYPQRVEYI